MEHRYKRAILHDMERLDRDKAFTGENGVWNADEKLKELDEVYRKAQAYDEIVKVREKIGNEIGLADYYETEDFGKTVIDIVDKGDDNHARLRQNDGC